MLNIKVVKGILASYYGQLITILYQVISVPIFMHYWGTAKYSEWLVIYTIPSIIGMMELGIFNIIINKLSYFKERSNADFNRLINLSNSLLILLLCLVFTLLLVSFLIFNYNISYLLVFGYSVFLLVNNFHIELFKIVMKYHVGCFIANTIRLIEYLVIILSVVFKLDIETCFYFLIIIRVFYSFYLYYFYIKEFFLCKLCLFRFSEFKGYLNFKEFFDNSLLPISLIFNNQILVIMIKYYFGDNSVILFSTLRTFFRFSNQLTAAINMSIWQEILCYVRAEDWNNHKKIVRKLLIINGSVLFFVSILYLFIGRDVFDYWTHGSIVTNYINYVFILFSVIFYAMWQPVYIYFNTLAKYNIYSYFYFLIQLMLLLSVCFLSFDKFLVSYFLSELLMLIFLLFVFFGKLKNKGLYEKK